MSSRTCENHGSEAGPPARPGLSSPSHSCRGQARHGTSSPGRGCRSPQRCCFSLALDSGPAGAGAAAGGAEELPRLGRCSTAPAAMLCSGVVRRRKGAAGELRSVSGSFFYSPKNLQDSVLFSRSGIMHWEGRLESLAWWGRNLGGVSGQGSLKIWRHCG